MAGVVRIEAIEMVPLAEIDDHAARLAGCHDREELVATLRGDHRDPVYRITLTWSDLTHETQVGWTDADYASRQFRRSLGYTPRTYRAMSRRKLAPERVRQIPEALLVRYHRLPNAERYIGGRNRTADEITSCHESVHMETLGSGLFSLTGTLRRSCLRSRRAGWIYGRLETMSFRRDSRGDFEQQITKVMNATVDALRSYDGTQNCWLRDFPRGSCRVTSLVLGSLLLELDYEPYGRWFLVSRLADREQNSTYDVSHVWLELRDSDGSVIYAIDATADQFPEWTEEPFVVFGRSLLAEHFSSIISETPMRNVNLANEGELVTAPLAHVRQVLRSEGEPQSSSGTA